MSNGLFDDPRLDAAWRAYAERDRRLVPGPELERRTLASCRAARIEGRQGLRLRGGPPLWRDLSLAAAVAAAAWLSWPRAEPLGVRPLEARAAGFGGLAATVAAARPSVVARSPAHRHPAATLDPGVQDVDLPEVLMRFEVVPLGDHEPLQMVRLRLPRGALQALGVAMLEPDAGAVVDVDVLVGEDGLPRDIRRVRIGQE